MENGRRPLYQQPHTKPALLGGNQQQGMLQGAQPMMWNQPQRQKPWYEQQPYGPAQFMVDTANKVAGVVSDPLFAIARGDLHRAAAGYVPGRQSDEDAGLARRSFDAAGAVMAGSSFAQAPRGALRSFAGQNEALDMSQEARMSRAKEMGFNTDQVLYHGTPVSFDDFKGDYARYRPTYLTDDADIADIYAGTHHAATDNRYSPQIKPVVVRDGKKLVISDRADDGSHGWNTKSLADALGLSSAEANAIPGGNRWRTLLQVARDRGYNVVEARNMLDLGGEQTQYMVLNTKDIRSTQAAFDPAQRNSANLMASHPFAGAIPVAANSEDQRRKRKGY